MTRNYSKRKPYTTCSCGQVMYHSIKTVHLKSTRHRYGAKIIQLLESGSTLLEVGNKLGITRERVRQIAAVMGVTPARTRMTERTEQRLLDEFLNKLPHSRLGRLLEAAVAHGLTNNQLVPIRSAIRNGQYSRERVLINGKLVAVRASWGRRNGEFVSIRYPQTDNMDYVAFELPDGRFLFLKPRDLGSNTMFAVYEVPCGGKGYTYTKRHDFREGIEAWHLFTDGDK